MMRANPPVLLAATLLLMTATAAWTRDEADRPPVLAPTDISVTVNDSPIVFEEGGPRLRAGRVLIPLRGVLEKMGALVEWDAGDRAVMVTHGENLVYLPIGSRTATRDGRRVRLDVPAQVVEGRTLVPLRFVAEAFGANVDWIAEAQEVRIETLVRSAER